MGLATKAMRSKLTGLLGVLEGFTWIHGLAFLHALAGDGERRAFERDTPTWNARFSSIRPIPRLSRRSGQGAPSWSSAWPPASISYPAWCRTIGGRERSSGARRW